MFAKVLLNVEQTFSQGSDLFFSSTPVTTFESDRCLGRDDSASLRSAGFVFHFEQRRAQALRGFNEEVDRVVTIADLTTQQAFVSLARTDLCFESFDLLDGGDDDLPVVGLEVGVGLFPFEDATREVFALGSGGIFQFAKLGFLAVELSFFPSNLLDEFSLVERVLLIRFADLAAPLALLVGQRRLRRFELVRELGNAQLQPLDLNVFLLNARFLLTQIFFPRTPQSRELGEVALALLQLCAQQGELAVRRVADG